MFENAEDDNSSETDQSMQADNVSEVDLDKTLHHTRSSKYLKM